MILPSISLKTCTQKGNLMSVSKTESIRLFLKHKARDDLASLYHDGMEVQVNVAQDGGDRVDGEYRGRQFTAWTDGNQFWKSFRIPWHASTEPEYIDSEIKFDLAEHAEAIGMTGWCWKDRKSYWVAFDFDAILGHSEAHEAKLSDAELQNVRKKSCEIPWVTVRKSTSGNGFHLYVFLDGVETANHTEHQALARAILSKMSALAGYDFTSKVDACGGNMWIWHRKFDQAGGKDGQGLILIKEGTTLKDIPINWKDHVKVSAGKRNRATLPFVKEQELDWFDEMCGQHPKVPLDEDHKKLMETLDQMGALWWWDSDRHMIVCHTADLKSAHDKLSMKGIFNTIAQGAEQGSDQNCFAFPMKRGAWVIRRHTRGVNEESTWDQDGSGWTRCYLNREPDLMTASRAHGGIEDEKGGFVFGAAEVAIEAMKDLGAHIQEDLPSAFLTRQAIVRPHKDGRRLILEIAKADVDPNVKHGWILKAKKWIKIFNTKTPAKYEPEILNHDDLIRHLVSHHGGDAGWVIKADSEWKDEPMGHVKIALKAQGYSASEADLIMGQGVIRRWTLTNIPFGVEYPGGRVWNRDAAQFAVAPTLDVEKYKHPTWDKVLNHCGSGLDSAIKEHPWCSDNGILTGGEYLKLWIASMFQFPFEPLPYLFFYGPQGSGKSIFHEAISLLVKKGVVRADTALISSAGFNGELASAVLCVVEETDLRKDRTQAYNRIKDWTTGRTINIHVKGITPYTAKNSTHWAQMANSIEECPVFPGDTRITMLHVNMLSEDEYIAKRDLIDMLLAEAPDFLGDVMKMEIPRIKDRLNMPVIMTAEKEKAERANQNELEAFIEDQCHYNPGHGMLWGTFYERFKEWLDPERRPLWSKRKTGQYLPVQFPKGRNMKEKAKFYIGNISFSMPQPADLKREPAKLVGDKLQGLVDDTLI